MLLQGIVKKYTADLILLTKFRKVVGMKEKFTQNMEAPVSLKKFLLQTQGTFGGGFSFFFEFLHFMMDFKGIRISKSFPFLIFS